MAQSNNHHSMKRTVCIVDDSEDMRDVLARLMRSVGLTPEVYDSAEAFLRRGHGSETGCLLLDVQLGGMSGLDLLDQLSGNGLTYPVFIITGEHDIRTMARASRHRAIMVYKPFDAYALARDVLRSLDEAAS